MRASHFHLFVRDLEETLRWMETVWQQPPVHRGTQFAVVPFGDALLVLDAADRNSEATLGFASDDCDRDYRAVMARGATVLEAPADRSWGVRVAYIRGPGGLTFEIEQPLTQAPR